MQHVFRPIFGRALTVVIATICGVAVIAAAVGDGFDVALGLAPWLALVTGVCWAIFWRPQVEVSDSGVRVVNVLRTIDLPWPSIHAIDTKWALTLLTAYGTFTAWAAPSPGVRGAMRATSADARHLPVSTYSSDGIRPGDLPSSPSGEAAALIRRHWETLRDAGHLDNPRLERDRPPVRWHIATVLAGAGLTGLGLLGVMV